MELAIFIFFTVCVTVQAYYSLRYFYPLANYQSSEHQSTNEHSVSVVVASRNEAKNLPKLLNSLIKQVYTDYEIIIVNDRSTDESTKILEDYSAQHTIIRHLEITALPEGWTGKKHALAQGIASARNEIILLTDADCEAKSAQWVKQMVGQFEPSTEFVLGFSPYQSRPGLLNHFIQYETLWTAIQYLSLALVGRPYMGVGRNLAYRKSTFDASGFEGLEHITGGDDDLLVNRLAHSTNTKIAIEEKAQVQSIPKTNWKDFFIQKARHVSVGKHYRQKDRTRLGLFALSSLFGWLLFFYLLITGYNPIWILIIFGFRSMLFYIIFTRTGRKLGVRIIPVTLPLLDLFYNVFYLVVGLKALTAKRITWS